MKVIAAINGTITSESMAFYALKYAQVQKLTLVLLHIENEKDDIDDVEASIERIRTLADSLEIQIEPIFLKGELQSVMQTFLSSIYADIIFCSTRKHKSLISNSFSEALTKMDLNVDIAIVRIVKISHIMDLSAMMLSINQDKLSVKKFTFFATLASAYEADGEIYSVSSMSKRELTKIDKHKAKNKLSMINFNLRHYIKLSYFMPFKLHIKHDFSSSEQKSILTHMAKSNAQLAVIGARRLSISSFFSKEIPIEKLMSESSINIIAYYPKEDQ
jgi:hypothetical protein